MSRKFFEVLALSFLIPSLHAQNLVSNPGFEESTGCPEKNGDIKKSISWSTTSAGSTPDYFHRCFYKTKAGVEIGVPQNSEGSRQPHSGDAYAGMAVFFKRSYYGREYLQNKLAEPLEKGVKYKVSLYISLSDSSEFETDHLGFLFTDVPNGIMAQAPEPLLASRRLVTVRNSPAFQSHQWTWIEAEYRAIGGEAYLIIGSFRANMTMKEFRRRIRKPLQPCKNHECAAYYYIDDVEVSEIPEEKLMPKF
jgi:OOP family OmpA-OmpF porin